MPQKVVAWLTNTLASMKAVDGVQEEDKRKRSRPRLN
jgi:hypothetical protein